MSRSDGVAIDRLIVRVPNWLGDAVMALPAIAAVRRAFPASRVVVAARAGVAPLFRERIAAAPNEVVMVDERGEAGELRAVQADAVLLLPNSFRSAWVARLAGIRERWGYRASGRTWLLTRSVARPRRAGGLHQVHYYRELVRGLGIDPGDDVTPRVTPQLVTLEKADALLLRSGLEPGQRIAGFAPGAAPRATADDPADRPRNPIALECLRSSRATPTQTNSGAGR